MLTQHLGRKSLQHLFPGNVTNEVFSLLLVNDIYYGSLRTKLPSNASANTVGTTGYYDYFIFECIHLILLYHQHYPSLGLCESIGEATDYRINLIGSNGVSILAYMQTLAVYHFRNLLCPHPSVLTCKAEEYGFFYFHIV